MPGMHDKFDAVTSCGERLDLDDAEVIFENDKAPLELKPPLQEIRGAGTNDVNDFFLNVTRA